MGTVDFVILGIIAISALLGLLKGFLRGFVSLLSLVVGLVVAFYFAELPLQWIPDETIEILGESILLHDIGLVVSFIVAVLVVMLIGKLLGLGLYQVVAQGGMKRLDQFIGLLFGIVRGALIVVLLVVATALVWSPEGDIWQESILLPSFTQGAHAVVVRLPEEYNRHFMFDLNMESADVQEEL